MYGRPRTNVMEYTHHRKERLKRIWTLSHSEILSKFLVSWTTVWIFEIASGCFITVLRHNSILLMTVSDFFRFFVYVFVKGLGQVQAIVEEFKKKMSINMKG